MLLNNIKHLQNQSIVVCNFLVLSSIIDPDRPGRTIPETLTIPQKNTKNGFVISSPGLTKKKVIPIRNLKE